MPNLKIVEDLWNGKSSGDVGKALIWLGAAGWFFSALAQIVMLYHNKDIDKKEKKFLIPQEMADGVINVTLYYTICQSIKKYGDNLVEKGQYITSKMDKFIRILNTDSSEQDALVRGFSANFHNLGILNSKKQKEHMSNFFEGIMNYVKNGIPENVVLDERMAKAFQQLTKDRTVQEQIDLIKDTQRNFQAFKNGVGILLAIGASVLACNIITPIARNITANYFQRRLVKGKSCVDKQFVPDNKVQAKPLSKYTDICYSLPKSNIFRNFNI